MISLIHVLTLSLSIKYLATEHIDANEYSYFSLVVTPMSDLLHPDCLDQHLLMLHVEYCCLVDSTLDFCRFYSSVYLALHQPGDTVPFQYLGRLRSRKKGVSGFFTSPDLIILLSLFMRIFLTFLSDCARLIVSFGSSSKLKRYSRLDSVASYIVCA